MIKIPIVLASDKNCISQMYTTILSALENKKQESFYEFYCLIPQKFSKYTNNKFYKLVKKYKNANLKFVKMNNAFSDIKMQIPHITYPTFYRLKMADLLPQEYEKAIYLDIDITVLEDLTELFNINLEDNYIGGVHSINYFNDYITKSKPYYDSIGIPDMRYYINAGVMLWNLKKIREDNLTAKFLELSKNTYKYMDQDIINLTCYGKIKHIDFKFNTMTSIKQSFFDKPENRQQVFDFYGEKSFQNAVEHPVIIHYASDAKPWNNTQISYRKQWLYYAKKSPFKSNLKQQSIKSKFLAVIQQYKLKKVAFWGASLFLKDLILTKKIKHHRLLGIIDKNSSMLNEKIGNIQVYSPEELRTLNPDIVIFAVKNNNLEIYPKIKEYLKTNYPKIKLAPNPFDAERKS